jgi:hydroxyacylglutathione hydrolase
MPLQIACIPSPPLETNAYIVAEVESKKALVIDPSFVAAPILEFLKQQGWTLERIVLTHGHIDHTCQAAQLASEMGVPIFAHELTLPYLENDSLSCADYLGLKVEPFGTVQPLVDGDKIALGCESFTVVHTPGHTTGCICLLEEHRAVCFTGDLVFQGSVGRSDFPGGNHATLQKSVERLFSLCQPDTTLYPGHGPETTPAFERVNNPYLA